MSTPTTTSRTASRPQVASTPLGPADTPNPNVAGGAAKRVLAGPLKGLGGMETSSKKWSKGSFGMHQAPAGVPQAAGGPVAAVTAAPALPTGYSLPSGVGGPSMPDQPQMPQPQVRQPQIPIPPNQPPRQPMFNDGQSPLHHLWNSLVKIGEGMAGLIHAIARAMGNVH